MAEEKDNGIRERVLDPEKAGADSGLKHITQNDLVNFLNGRSIMVARQVDELCTLYKNTPSAQEGLTKLFNMGVMVGGPDLNFFSSQTVATFTVMQRPEYKDVEERFLRIGAAIKTALGGTEGVGGAPDEQELSKGLTAEINPEIERLMICNPRFMDPLVEMALEKPLDAAMMSRFERDVYKEAVRTSGMDYDTFKKEQDKAAPVIERFIR